MSHWVKEKGFSHKGAIAQQQFGLGEYHHVLGTVDAREGEPEGSGDEGGIRRYTLWDAQCD